MMLLMLLLLFQIRAINDFSMYILCFVTVCNYDVVDVALLLLFQIRAINDFSLTGNWSDSIVLLNTTQEPKLGPSTTQSSPTKVYNTHI